MAVRTGKKAVTERRPRLDNADVAGLFDEMADLLEVEAANPFRVRAYRVAARSIAASEEPVASLAAKGPGALRALHGVGEDLAGKIAAIVRTGRFAELDAVRRKAPRGVLPLLAVPGIGPRRARLLAQRHRIHSLADLARAARAHRLRTIPGFGAASEERIARALAQPAAGAGRSLRARVAPTAERLAADLARVPGVVEVAIAGSYRRGRDTVGDLDLVACARTPAAAAAAIERFVQHPDAADVRAHGGTRATIALRSGLAVDLRVVAPASFGAALLYLTGSKAHNIALRRLALAKGLKLNEYGAWKGKAARAGRTEKDVYAALGLPLIPPELREDRGEIEAARAGRLPRLLTLSDVRGDLQMHTTDSDGSDTLEAMAEAAQALGYEYIAVTDHSPAVRVAGGMDRRGFLAQMKRIDRLNARLPRLRVLKGAEVDLLADGTLDLDAPTRTALDIVLVSIHSHFDLPPDAQTRRVTRGLAAPAVDVLAHPTGRLLSGRRGARFDLDTVVRAAVDHGVMLEIDAQPDRMDLDDIAVMAAKERHARFTISTDAHHKGELALMPWGVAQARRGWLEAKDVANTRSLARLLPLLHAGRR